MNTERRLAEIRRRLAHEELPAMLVTGRSNMRYLTGFESVFDEGINAACLVAPELARFYTDARYVEAARLDAVGTPWVVKNPQANLYVEICRELQAEGITSLALESSVPYGRFKFISEQFVGSIRILDQFVEQIRQVKETQEIERIEAAARITDEAFEHIVAWMRPGLTEREVALELEFWMRRRGSDGVAFAPIVASGPNAARPHHHPGDRAIEPGDLVILDFGARVGAYCADMTRTVVVGRASDRQRELHDAVLRANRVGVDAITPGIMGKDVDAAARAIIDEAGMGEWFTHGLGHGVGLDVHELPGVGRESRDVLRTGSVVTVEPGVYVEGFGGVRIEDLVVVDEHGPRVLTSSPRELIEV